MSKKFFWLKLKEDFFGDKRIKKLRKIAGGDTYTIIYLKLQLLSLKNNGVIIYEGVEETLEEELALEIDEELENVKVTILFLKQNSLFEEIEKNHFVMVETLKCIGSETDSAIRVRKHRELKGEKQKALQCNNDVTKCNIEIDKDIDINKELEKEKEINKEKEKTKRFSKPTIEQIQEYCKERGNNINAQYFYNYYESNGWCVGKNKMKDWKATIRNWEIRDKNNQSKKSEYSDIAQKIQQRAKPIINIDDYNDLNF